ncbi:MAG: PKD domain-containing protein [Saprospiraceae bacterium]|nr:PKD domain-containing protein [Saprospiraceae bacterium]
MRQIPVSLLLGLLLAGISGCKKDDFPVPPASTVAQFTFTVNNDGFAPAEVRFTNTSIVPERAGNVTYTWNFGDGASAQGTDAVHLYTAPGVYEVNLVAVTENSLEIRQATKTLIIKDPAATGIPVYFTDGSAVFRGLVNNLAPVVETLPVTGLQNSYGTTFDTVNNHLYISDYDGGVIYRCQADGTGQVVFQSGVDAPNALSIDYVESKLYWDTGNGVQRTGLGVTDPTQREDFVTGQANDPDGICIDPVGRTLYWVNYNGGVWKKNLDGTGEAEIIPGVEGGSLIVVGNRIFFDQYIGPGDIHLKSADLDGGNIAVLATGITRVVYALAYEKTGQKIYWGDRNNGTIQRANLDGSGVETWYLNEDIGPRGISFGK